MTMGQRGAEAQANLAAYLSDHAGGSASGIALVERLANHFAGQRLGAVCAELAAEIRADQATLLTLIERTGGAVSGSAKRAVGRVGEFLSRVRTPLTEGAEPFSTFEGLELLGIGVLGKRSLWAALEAAVSADPRLDGLDYGDLILRAEDQFARIEQERIRLAANVL